MTTTTQNLLEGNIEFDPENDNGLLHLSFPHQENIKYTVDVRFGELDDCIHYQHNLSDDNEGFVVEQPKSLKLHFSGIKERKAVVEVLEHIIKELKELDEVTYIHNDIFNDPNLKFDEMGLLLYLTSISKERKIVKEEVENRYINSTVSKISKNKFNKMWNLLVKLGYLYLTNIQENGSNIELWKINQTPY